MKWKVLLPSVISLAVITGCNGVSNNSQSEQDQISNELAPTKKHDRTNEEMDNKLGYVRYDRNQLNDDHEIAHEAQIDRSKMADMITRMILRNHGFDEVATLVTDQEVLIAYQLNDNLDATTAADIASKTAKSTMPGFFNIYVSDNRSLMNDIQSLHNSSVGNQNYDNTINQIIDEMKKSPQGRKDDNQDKANNMAR
ncbi:YhcN/YlaJ family sporulation lipoprotein [Lentibacillus sp. N15]|uniref:YhcN/YlaJ family sporulation lipoprotein n=1 Tax=Lentibacillus songyuanensis TaxID=3136161 RepID=UPI0031BA05DE